MSTSANLRLTGIDVSSSDLQELERGRVRRASRRALAVGDLRALPTPRPAAVPLFGDDAGRTFAFVDVHGIPEPVRYVAGDSAATRERPTLGGFFASRDFTTGAAGKSETRGSKTATDGGARVPSESAAAAATDLGKRASASLADGDLTGQGLLRKGLLGTATQAGGALLGEGGLAGALDLLTSPAALVSNVGAAALNGLASRLQGALLGEIFGEVTDASSAGDQLMARFAPQVFGTLQTEAFAAAKSALFGAAGAEPSAIDRLHAFVNGAESQADVPFGQNLPAGGDHLVLVGGLPCSRLEDVVALPGVDEGPFVEGNSTILVNGKPAVGSGHHAVGLSKGTTIFPLFVAPTVLMGLPKPPPSAPTPCPEGSDNGNASHMEYDEKEGMCIARPQVKENGKAVTPPSLEWPGKLGLGNNPFVTADGRTFDNFTMLWGTIELGSPQQPEAGTFGLWWIPDRIFGYDVRPYYLYHDLHFSDERDLTQFGDIVTVEAEAFLVGANRVDGPAEAMLQIVYSSGTLIAGLTFGAINSLKDLFGVERNPAPDRPRRR